MTHQPASRMADLFAVDDPRTAEAPWTDAAAAAFDKLIVDLRKGAKDIRKRSDPEPIHDMRTATRRLRTAATIYRSAFPNRELRRLERELRRVAHRLGAARDLDVLLETLEGAKDDRDGARRGRDGADPLRREWTRERRQAARRLRSELRRGRFRRSLKRAARLADGARSSDGRGDDGGRKDPVMLVAHRAPSTIWKSFGEVLAYDVDPRTALPDEIHQMRIAAKGFRYTLEAFEDALGRGLSTLIEEVTDLQDAAGEMHDAIVAAQRARTLLREDGLDEAGRQAVERYAAAQDLRAERLRPTIHRRLRTVQGPGFRRTLGNATVVMAGKGSRPAVG